MKLLNKFILGFSLLLILSMVMVSSSCKKDYVIIKTECTPTTDANGLQKIIAVTDGKLTKGTLPDSTSSPNSPRITIFQPSVATGAGYELTLPLRFTSSTELEYIYLQVKDATNGFFKIDITEAVRGFGTIIIPLDIPLLVCKGEFTVRFCLIDYNGLVSSVEETTIVIRDPFTCSDANNSGTEGLTFTQVDMGSKSGDVVLSYDTYSVPDRVDVFQGTKWIGGTGSDPGSVVPPLCNCNSLLPGFIGKRSRINFRYEPSAGRIITVVVSGCLGGGTAWEWNLTCPE